MKVSKAIQFGTVPAGIGMWLSKEQALARAHVLTAIETDKKTKDRMLYVSDTQVGFKAGEELALEGDLDRSLMQMFGLTEAPKTSETPAKGRKASDGALRKAFDEGKAHATREATKLIEDARSEGHKAGRSEMLSEVLARDALFEAIENAEAALAQLDADATPEIKAAAENAVADARAAVDALKDLEA